MRNVVLETILQIAFFRLGITVAISLYCGVRELSCPCTQKVGASLDAGSLH